MSLPDMADVLLDWQTPRRVKTVTRQTVNFVAADVVVGRDVPMLVQPASPEALQVLDIDHSLRYIQIHSTEPLSMGELVEYGAEDFKIITPTNYQDYDYTSAIAEQTKRALLVETP
jgi:hypothetical protein